MAISYENVAVNCATGVVYSPTGVKLALWETDGSRWWFAKYDGPLVSEDYVRTKGVQLYRHFDFEKNGELRRVAAIMYAKFHGGLHDAQRAS